MMGLSRPPVSSRWRAWLVRAARDNRNHRSQLLMAVVADGRRFGALAGTQQRAAIALHFPLQRLDAGAFMRAVAERLAVGTAAAAPPIGLAGHKFDEHRLTAADHGFAAHGFTPPASVASHASPQAFANSRTRRM